MYEDADSLLLQNKLRSQAFNHSITKDQAKTLQEEIMRLSDLSQDKYTSVWTA